MPPAWKIIVIVEALFNVFGGLYMALKPAEALTPLLRPELAKNQATLLFGAELYRIFAMMVALQGMAFIRCRNSSSICSLLQLAFIGDLAYLYCFYRFVAIFGDFEAIGVIVNFALTGFFTGMRLYTMVASWRAFKAPKSKLT